MEEAKRIAKAYGSGLANGPETTVKSYC
jgi:hypothetical protein